MEGENKMPMNNRCGCGPCTMDNMMHGPKVCNTGYNHLIKIILKLIILMMIFCFGFKLGEMSGMIHGSRNSHMMKAGYMMMNGDRMMEKATFQKIVPTESTDLTITPVQ